MDKLKEYLSHYDQPKILDMGSGKGDFIHLLNTVYQDYQEIIGIDIVDYILEMDEEAFDHNPKIKWMDKDVLDTVFPEHSFDVISLSNTLHHVKNIKSLLTKMAKLLKPDGIMIITEMYTTDELSDQQVSHEILHTFSAKILHEINMVHSQFSNRECVLDAIKQNTDLSIQAHWDLETDDYTIHVDVEYVEHLLDDLLGLVKDSPKYNEYLEESIEIKKYLNDHDLSFQNQICVVLKSE